MIKLRKWLKDKFINEQVIYQTMSDVPSLSCEEWLLAFLKLNKEQPIKGRLLFIKMLFVANKELLNDSLQQLFNFYPDKHGPYSKKFPFCLESLKIGGLLTETKVRNEYGYTYEYTLTKKGDEIISNKVSELGDDLIKRLSELKRAFLELGHMKVLRYVYQKYPEYTSASIIKDDVRNANFY